MKHKPSYHVETKRNDTWARVVGSQGLRSYAYGWYDALTSFYPRPAYRLVRTIYDDTHDMRETTVLDESKPVGAPKPASTKKIPPKPIERY